MKIKYIIQKLQLILIIFILITSSCNNEKNISNTQKSSKEDIKNYWEAVKKFDNNEFLKAKQYLLNMKNIGSSYGYSYFMLGIIYEKEQNFKIAITNFNKYLVNIVEPENFEMSAIGHLMYNYLKLGKITDSKKYNKKIRGSNKAFPLSLAGLGYLEYGIKYKSLYALEIAEKILLLAFSIDNKNSNILNSLGRVYLNSTFISKNKQSIDNAIKYFELAIQITPKDTHYNNLGVAYWKKYEFTKNAEFLYLSKNNFSKAVKYNKNFNKAKNNLIFITNYIKKN